MSTPDNWPATVALPGVVSEGTLNTDHLLPIFARLVKEIDYELYVSSPKWCTPCLDAIQKGEHHAFGLRESDERQELLVDLWDALQELEPEGYYFGSVEGDPACIGFFEVDTES